MKEQETQKNLASTRNLIIWLLLISLSGITFFTAYYFTPTLQNRDKIIDPCPEDIATLLEYKHERFNIQDNPVIAMEINDVTTSNQFISLEAFPIVESSSAGVEVEIKFEVSSFAVDSNQAILFQFEKKHEITVTFYPPGANQKEYSAESLAKIDGVNHQNYLFVIKITNADEIQEQKVRDLQMSILTLNPTYSQRLNYFKWFLFTVALVSWIFYRNNLSKLPNGYTSREQDYISQMAFILLFFTQPVASFFAFSTAFWYKIFIVVVVAALGYNLVSFWLSLLKRLHASPNPPSGSNAFIFLVACAHFLAIAGGYGLLVKEQDENPLLDYEADKTLGITVSKYYSYAFVGIIGLWTLVKLPKVLGRIRELDWRDSGALLFSFYYILCYAFFIITGSLQVTAVRGTRVVLLFGITTLYTVLLQVMYGPFGGEVEEAEKRKKYNNPATANQYDDLDMSDTNGPKDDVELKGRDELKGKAKNMTDDESEEI